MAGAVPWFSHVDRFAGRRDRKLSPELFIAILRVRSSHTTVQRLSQPDSRPHFHISESRNSMAPLCSKHPYRFHIFRTFINTKIKWVCDPFLDESVQREKNVKQIIHLKNQILFSPTKVLPISTLSPLKSHLNIPITITKFIEKYPTIFTQFQPNPGLPFHIKITQKAVSLHKEEMDIHNSLHHRDDIVKRLAKVLMLTRARKLPFNVIERFKWDLGLPYNYVTTLLSDYPEYFQVCGMKDVLTGKEELALELVCWRDELAVSALEDRNWNNRNRIKFPMSLPRGFDLEKKVQIWVDEWQNLPYISPYEDAFHLTPSSDQAEKWAVGVLHELLWLLVSKKTERENLFCLGEYLGFGGRFKKALAHFPGIFYVSNKIRTQTVVLREAYRKDFLMEKHPLMGMRFRYISIMNKASNSRNGVIRKLNREV